MIFGYELSPIAIDAIWVAVTFLLGLAFRALKQPALIGFLITGILLNYLGIVEGNLSRVLETLSSLGVMLLLFSIGLKIKLKLLFNPQVYAVATIHAFGVIVLFGLGFYTLSFTGIYLLSGLDLATCGLISFALSFSSTVFVVKILEEKGELSSMHGRLALGILIIQDVFAVLFMGLAGKTEVDIWILLLPIYLLVIRELLGKLLKHSGHGELLTIFGFFSAFVTGGYVFHLLGLKADLGALAMGMLLVSHPKAEELHNHMMGYKDLFLVAFFISIGLKEIPGIGELVFAFLLSLTLFFKGGLFVFILSFFNIRARSNFLASIALSNFSEFGLIVIYFAAQQDLVSERWLMILGLTMSFSFFISSFLNSNANDIYERYRKIINLLNRGKKFKENDTPSLEDAEVVVVGMGTLGIPAYNYLNRKFVDHVVGIDYSADKVYELRSKGYKALVADASNNSFWDARKVKNIKLVILAISDFASNYQVLKAIHSHKNRHYMVGCISNYDDEKNSYLQLGADFVYDYKTALGEDFAQQFFHFASSKIIS